MVTPRGSRHDDARFEVKIYTWFLHMFKLMEHQIKSLSIYALQFLRSFLAFRRLSLLADVAFPIKLREQDEHVDHDEALVDRQLNGQNAGAGGIH